MGRRLLLVVVALAAMVVTPSVPAVASPPWAWPIVGPIVRGYDPPDSPYGAGHRGIDIAAAVGSVVVAPDDGVVTFAGLVGGRLFLTIDHGGGLSTTSSWLTSLLVRKGANVTRGQSVATTGWGHADLTVPHLHFGVRLDGEYVDPLAYLDAPSITDVIRLAPLEGATAAGTGTGTMTGLAYASPPVPARVGPAAVDGGGLLCGASCAGDAAGLAAVSGRSAASGSGGVGTFDSLPRVVASRRGNR